MSLHDIKDHSSNANTIRLLEEALEEARSGELRSVIIAKGFDDNCVNHVWSLDSRNYWRVMLAEIVMLQHDFTVNIELRDGDSVLVSALK